MAAAAVRGMRCRSKSCSEKPDFRSTDAIRLVAEDSVPVLFAVAFALFRRIPSPGIKLVYWYFAGAEFGPGIPFE